MIWLVLGLLLWSAVHSVPTLAQPLRQRLIDSLGKGPYRAVFSLVVVASIVLMVIGWRATPVAVLYHPPAWAGPIGFVLMIVAFVLLGASQYATAIKRFVRHPQLTAIVVWSVSHLITNGSTRALVLFGGLGVWALIEMRLINAREGVYKRPAAPGWQAELRGLAISAIIFAIAVALHPYFAGVSALPP